MTHNLLYTLNSLPRLLPVVTHFIHPDLNFRLSTEVALSFLISNTPAHIFRSSNTYMFLVGMGLAPDNSRSVSLHPRIII